jgi:GTPase
MSTDSLLVEALRRYVDELEGARRQTLRERCHGAEAICILHRMTARRPAAGSDLEPERGLVVAVLPKGVDATDELAEMTELARTAGVEPVGELVQHRVHPDPRTYVGKGKLAELKSTYAETGAEVLLVDDELSPPQQRALEDALTSRVVDRTQLILDIFAQHAVSAEGKLQVELAQLEYNLPRMRGMWQHLERQAGGGGTARVGGGVGTRGPGELQLESDRRIARRRITLMKKRLKALGAQRATRRKQRRRAETPTVALAGYTNVGKSTLLNALTGAEVSVENRLFETLDPTTRGFEYMGKRYLVTDTVGFIRRLPTQLVEGFASTLEETLVADLVLHVADASLAEDRLREQIAAVDAVLTEIGGDQLPVELVLNKVDLVDALTARRLANRFPHALAVSATSGEGLAELRQRIAERFADRFEDVRLFVPYDEGGALAALYALGAPISERLDTDEGVVVRARLPHREVRRFAAYLVADAPAETADHA